MKRLPSGRFVTDPVSIEVYIGRRRYVGTATVRPFVPTMTSNGRRAPKP
jgi:hypothetical protein